MPTNPSIRRSVLWAAYGDALGFITELSNESSLLHRTKGKSQVTALIPWVRRIGGQFGVYVELPKGCYSDDTQLRLATSRSIRGDGSFDVETFSKIEIPVWLSYEFGSGIGTKTAAQSLKRNQVQWNSNFYKSKYAQYIDSGGNGAAMRIQPHVWSAPPGKGETAILRDVIRNTITTHGHMRALIGAAFHALILHGALSKKEVPDSFQWHHYLEQLTLIPKIIQSDTELTMFWLPNWEQENNESIEKAVQQSIQELRDDIFIAEDYIKKQTAIDERSNSYLQLVERIGCLTKKFVGSAPKTALLAAYLSYVFKERPHDGLVQAVNVLGSDTDTIATMAGAIMGAVSIVDPPEKVLDVGYLEKEAERLFELSQGHRTTTYNYPDMLYWRAPVSQIDALGQHEGKWVLQGLGELTPLGNPLDKKSKSSIDWQWFKLNFGQTVLIKRRPRVNTITEKTLPTKTSVDDTRVKTTERKELGGNNYYQKYPKQQYGLWDSSDKEADKKEELTVDAAAALAVKSKFKANTVGALLLQLSTQEDGIKKAMSFAEIIAKAKRARIKKVDTEGNR